MEKMKSRIILDKATLVALLIMSLAGCVNNSKPRYEIMTGHDECDSTFFIINTLDSVVVYEGGWNRIKKDTVIGNNHVYIEDIISEECSENIIICNDQYENLHYAAHLLWCDKFNKHDWNTFVKKKMKGYRIFGLDISKKQIILKYFNNEIDPLILEEMPPYSIH